MQDASRPDSVQGSPDTALAGAIVRDAVARYLPIPRMARQVCSGISA